MSIALLRADLTVDRVIGAGVAQAHYGVSLATAKRAGLRVRRLLIGATARSLRAGDFDVIVSPKFRYLQSANENTLRHLAGVTATRLHLRAPAGAWLNEGGAPLALLEPDGYWSRPDVHPGATWAIEYDAGSYSGEQVREKILTFRYDYGYQVWGVASEKRVDFIERHLRATDSLSLAQVHYVPWV